MTSWGREEGGRHQHHHTEDSKHRSQPRYPPQVAGMASRHGSQLRCNRAAEDHRTVNPAPLRLRKAPERICVIHRATMTRLAHRDPGCSLTSRAG
jgi:hypothetical protein